MSAPTTLPDASVGSAYSYQVPGCGTFSISAGSLPSGLSISSSGLISGTAPSTVQTSIATIKATSGAAPSVRGVHADIASTSATEQVAVPVTQTVKVDSAGGEVTGMANDGNLVYAAGSSAGDVFDLNAASPGSHGTAFTGLAFPVAISVTSGELHVAQFDEPAAAGAPTREGPAPTSTASPPTVPSALQDGDTQCSGADAITAYQLGPESTEQFYSCAASNILSWGTTVVSIARTPLGANGVPSGIAYLGNGTILVGDARNNTVTMFQNSTRLAVATLPAGSEPANIAFDSANNTAYVADPGTGHVSIVQVSSFGITYEGDFAVGSRPFGVAVNSSGTELVATNSGDGTADVISLSGTPTIQYTPTVGNTPDGVTIVGPDAFVADERGGTVTVIDPPGHRGLRRRLKILHPRRHRARRAASVISLPLGDPLIAPLTGGT